MAFKMKGHSLPGINQRSDAKKGSSAFQKHDGKKFKDAGFMDTHFPSGAPRNESAMKMYGDKKNPGLKMKQDSPMKGYKSDAQRKAVHASKAESAMKKTTYTLKGKGKVSKAEYEKAVGGKAGSKLSAMKMYGKKSPAKAHKEGHGEKSRSMKPEMMKPTKIYKPLKPTKKVAIHKSKLGKATREGLTEGLAERVKKGLKKDSPAKLVGKTIKKIKAKRAAKKEMKKSGKGQVVTSVATAAMKMYGKKSAMKKVGTMSDAEKAKAEKARVKKAYLQYQAKQVAALERGDKGIKVMTFTQYKDKMGS